MVHRAQDLIPLHRLPPARKYGWVAAGLWSEISLSVLNLLFSPDELVRFSIPLFPLSMLEDPPRVVLGSRG